MKKQAIDRRNYIGSSDAAAILGLSRWQTQIQVWAIKTGQIVPPEADSEAVTLGKELEDYVARRFMRVTGKKVQRHTATIFHKQYPFLGASIDRKVIGENAVLECKTTSAWRAKEWEGEEIPQEYIIQVLHQLMVGGFQKGYIAVLIGNQKFLWKEIWRDELMIEDIMRKEVVFWKNFVETKQMPIATITDRDSEILYQLFPEQVQKSIIELNDEAEKICEKIEKLEKNKKQIESEIEEQKNLLKAMLQTNELGITKQYKITWKSQVMRKLDTEKIKEEEPSIYDRYGKETLTRVLRISRKKD